MIFSASTPMFEKHTIWEELRVLKQIHLFGYIPKKKNLLNLINAESNLGVQRHNLTGSYCRCPAIMY